jgi:hypothetical protein
VATTKYMLLDKQTPYKTDDLLMWALWLEQDKDRLVARDTVGSLVVSTVFLIFGDEEQDNAPAWETLVFRDAGGDILRRHRYGSYTAAVHGHAAQLTRVLNERDGATQGRRA